MFKKIKEVKAQADVKLNTITVFVRAKREKDEDGNTRYVIQFSQKEKILGSKKAVITSVDPSQAESVKAEIKRQAIHINRVVNFDVDGLAKKAIKDSLK